MTGEIMKEERDAIEAEETLEKVQEQTAEQTAADQEAADEGSDEEYHDGEEDSEDAEEEPSGAMPPPEVPWVPVRGERVVLLEAVTDSRGNERKPDSVGYVLASDGGKVLLRFGVCCGDPEATVSLAQIRKYEP